MDKDKQNNNNIYFDLKQQKDKIKGIELGLKFLEHLYANLIELEFLSKSDSTEEVTLYDFIKNYSSISFNFFIVNLLRITILWVFHGMKSFQIIFKIG